jgi:hypothetical protein
MEAPLVLRPALVLALLVSACGKDEDKPQGDGYLDPSSRYAALVFGVVDPSYESSRIYVNKLGSGTLAEVVTGESGDPLIRQLGSRTFLFNRSPARLNFKTLDTLAATPTASAELALSGVGPFDPTDALLLDDGRLLLAGANGGSLAVIDPSTGALVQKIDAAWDLGAGTAFRPQLLVKHGSEIVVFTQGRGSDDFQSYDGSQHAYFLTDNGSAAGGLSPVDLDAAKDGVQGVALRVNPYAAFPSPVAGEEGKLYVFGLCGAFDGPACAVAGFDLLDVATRSVSTLYELDPAAAKNNGYVAAGADGKVYASVLDAAGAKLVVEISAAAKTVQTVHTFPAESAACCGLFYDDSSGRLWIGDREKEASSGFFTVFKPGVGIPVKVELPGIPYSGAFVTP